MKSDEPGPPPCRTCGAPTFAHAIRASIRGVRPGLRFLRYDVTHVWRCSAEGAAHDTVRVRAFTRPPV